MDQPVDTFGSLAVDARRVRRAARWRRALFFALTLLTAAAALQTLGPDARFATTVRLTGTTVTLVGGGDPYLTTKPSAKNAYPRTASLTELAVKTAAALKQRHLRSVSLAYDASLFSGPGLSPSWEPGYFPGGVIAPISL